jgi:glycerol-3-phosphate dehydrogenase
VRWSYSGVRPLLDDDAGDPSAVTRDYLLEMHDGAAPLLSVWGGKITTFRKLAEQAAQMLCQRLGVNSIDWTAQAALPGGDLSRWIETTHRPDHDIARFESALAARHPELPRALARRWSRSYGSLVELLLRGRGLGNEVAPGLFEAELRYLCEHEWARSADDVLWRRSKLGLHLGDSEREAVARWFAQRQSAPGSAVRLSAI